MGCFQLFATKFLLSPGGNSPHSLPFPHLVVGRLQMTGRGICEIFPKWTPTQISNFGSKFTFLERLPLQISPWHTKSLCFSFVAFRIVCNCTCNSCGLQLQAVCTLQSLFTTSIPWAPATNTFPPDYCISLLTGLLLLHSYPPYLPICPQLSRQSGFYMSDRYFLPSIQTPVTVPRLTQSKSQSPCNAFIRPDVILQRHLCDLIFYRFLTFLRYSSHTSLLALSWTQQEHSYLRAFALPVSFAWTHLLSDDLRTWFCSFPVGHSENITSSAMPSLTILSKWQTLPTLEFPIPLYSALSLALACITR